jgi:Sel1 repeat
MSQRLSLDRPTFERLLAAAALVQQAQNQHLRITFNSPDTIGLLGLVETQQAIQTGALDLEAACFQVTSLALKLTGAQGAGVWLFSQETLAYRAGAGTASNSERLRLAVLSGLAGNEPSSDAPHLDDSFRCSKAKSLLVAPIYQGPKISGALAVFSEGENAFSERDAANTRLLAGIVAHAVDKAADAELKYSMTLERAAMQKVVERLIPSLMRLTSQEQVTTPAVSSTQPADADSSPAVLAENPRPALSPVLPCCAASPGVAVQLPPHEPEEILASVGSLRRPERTFVHEADLAETSPRWVQSLNPGFDRWAPVGRSEPLPIPAARATSLDTTVLSPASLQKPAAVGDASLATPLVEPHAVLTLASQAPPAPPPQLKRSNRTELLAWLARSTRSALSLLVSIPSFRLNVRLAFNYKPTFRAMTVGLAAILLSVVALLALRSGERAILTTLSPGSSNAHANPVEPEHSAPVAAPSPKVSAAIASARHISRPVFKVPARSGRAGESSHLRITDSRASSALHGLSNYEIAALQRRAEYGDNAAAFVLGMAYEVGHGVPRNCTQAAKWVTRAALQGNAAAQYNLALRYRTADGVKANPEQAQRWFHKAARHRYAHAGPMPASERLGESGSGGQP